SIDGRWDLPLRRVRATDAALRNQDASTEEAAAGTRQPTKLAPYRSSLRVLSPFLRLEGIGEFLPSHPNPLPYKKTRFWEIPNSASRLLQSDKKERLIPLRSTETKSSNPTNKVSLNWFRVFLFGSAVI
ncbi:unnamed protein product, partial [Musa hybrid cultivar]